MHTLAIRTIDMVTFPTLFMLAWLYTGVFGVLEAAARIMQHVMRHFSLRTNNLSLEVKTSNLRYVLLMFLHQFSIALLQLQFSCNIAIVPPLQINNKLSYVCHTASIATT